MMKLTKHLPKNLLYILLMIAKVKDYLDQIKTQFQGLDNNLYNLKEQVYSEKMKVPVFLQQKKMKIKKFNLLINNSFQKQRLH